MEYKKTPTPKEILRSIDNILAREYDHGTRAKFLIGILLALEEPSKMRIAVLERLESIV